MAHKEQIEYCKKIKNKLPNFFKNTNVLDIGSLDINGSNRYLFEDCRYVGIDVGSGKNVDFVCKGHEFSDPDASYEVVISTECFEHDMYYNLTIKNAIRLLKTGGLFIFTCATEGRPEHGTRRTSPQDAPLLNDLENWSDYYKNLTEEDIENIVDLDSTFSEYQFEVNPISCDLYFYGVKK
jgi:SAM-dependent methyltransferase